MKFFKKSTYIRYVIGVIQISRNYATQIPFYMDSLKIKKDLELVSRPYFPNNFIIRKVIL